MAEENKNFVCIACPMGCPLVLTADGSEIKEVTGQQCNRGAKYAKQEFTDPKRSFSTIIPIEGALYDRLPVKLTTPVPKERIFEACKEIHKLRAKAPVKMGEVFIENLLGLKGVNVVACRSMKRPK
jgi:CxxC motif-containing protein